MNLCDPGAEYGLYESPVLRCFAGVGLDRAAAPDETAILRFRRLPEQNQLCGKILDTVNHYLGGKGLRILIGTIVDATIIAAPSSTRNSKGERDLEMHPTRKGNKRHFGAKAHVCVNGKEGTVHSVCTSASPASDMHMLPDLLHCAEKKVWGNAGYQGQMESIHSAAPETQKMTSRRTQRTDSVDEVERHFRILKRIVGNTK